MAKSGLFLPHLKDKHITNTETGKSRKQIVEERLRKRRNELRALCPPISGPKNIMDIERKALAPLSGPLVQWQLYRTTHDFPDVSLRLQEAKVDEWLHRNHFRVRRLPRLDPIVLTNRGSDFSRFMNFVFPPPYCLRFTSKVKCLKSSYNVDIDEIKERCPRLLRTQRNNMELFNLNPVIRVGGGYKTVSWQTAEVLPTIGQTKEDVTSQFSCNSCGVNLAVTQEISDGQNMKRYVITYPNICANCGKLVNRRRLRSHATSPHQSLPPLDLRERRLPMKYEDRDFDHNWQRQHTTENPSDIWTPRTQASYSDHDTGFSFTPDETADSVFITEADGSMRRIISSQRDYHGNTAEILRVHEDGYPMREQNIIEHRDPKSGMKIRVKRRLDPTYWENRDTFGFSEELKPENISQEENEHFGVRDRKDFIDLRSIYISGDSELDEESGYGRSATTRYFHCWKPKSKYSIYYEERNAKSDSELVMPTERHLFFKRKRKKSSKSKRRELSGSHSNPETNSKGMISKKRGQRTKSGSQSYAETKSEGMLSGEEWERIDSTSKKKRQQIKSGNQSNSENNSGEVLPTTEEWERMNSAVVGSETVANLSSAVELGKDDESLVSEIPDGYTADSEEADSLLKLQAEIKTLNKSKRNKNSGKNKKPKEEHKPRDKSGETAEKDNKSAHASAQKSKASLAAYGLDSDSWDSEESLHVIPIIDELSSDEDHVNHYQRPRALSFDLSDLPSYRRSQGFLDVSPSLRALTLDKRGFHSRYSRRRGLQRTGDHNSERRGERDDQSDADMEYMDTDLMGNKIGSKHSKNRYMASKYRRNKVYKPVPLPDTTSNPRLKSKWDEDDLNENDISLITAQMQQSFTKTKVQKSTDAQELYCKGQNCFRCGSFIDGCEGTCTRCGTHCKRLGTPCTVCRDICNRCGKPEVRCESRDQARGQDESHDEDIGINAKEIEGKVGVNCEEQVSQDEEIEDEFASEPLSTENSFSTLERTSTSRSMSKRGRKPITKKTKGVVSRGRRGNRQRTSTIDSTDTILEVTPMDSENEDKSDDDKEDIQESLNDEDDTLQVTKPEKSKYTKSKKKFKSSKQVVSQTVIYKNQNGDLISGDSSPLEKIAEVKQDSDEEQEKNENESNPEEPEETQVPTQELPAQEAQEEKCSTEEHIQEKAITPVEEKTEMKEIIKQEDKPKPQIPKPKLRGVQRVNAAYKSRVELNKRLQAMLKEAMTNVIAEADIKVRRDSTIDYLAQYRLVDRSKIEVYGRAFALEDEEEKGIISYEQMLLALEGVPTIHGMSRQQLNYVLQVLEINTFSRISFKMFAVITALCEKVTSLDSFVKEIVDGLDLTQTEWKLDLYKNMFYVAGDRSITFITPRDLRIELKAGGLNQRQEDHVISHITQSSTGGQISFLDYMAYLPLFLSIHKNICSNALDMSRDKYTSRKANIKA